MVNPNSLAVIGCGRMATAIVKGLSTSGLKYDPLVLYDIDQVTARNLAQSCQGQTASSLPEAVAGAKIVLLAVKPQVIPLIISELAASLSGGQIVISIAGGITTHYLEQELGGHPAIIRVMPNTPCLVGKGTLVICKGNYAKEVDLEAAQHLFSALGRVVMVNEEQMDAATALSGCGPAYFLLVAEALIDAGVEWGLNRHLAAELVQATLAGTGTMWEASADHPTVLKEQVTSPGGSTIAALRVLEERGLRAAMINAVARAVERTREIGKSTGKGV